MAATAAPSARWRSTGDHAALSYRRQSEDDMDGWFRTMRKSCESPPTARYSPCLCCGQNEENLRAAPHCACLCHRRSTSFEDGLMDMADDTTATDSVSTSWGSLQALELLNASSAMPTPCPSPEFRRPKRPSFRHEEGWEDEESYAACADISDDTSSKRQRATQPIQELDETEDTDDAMH